MSTSSLPSPNLDDINFNTKMCFQMSRVQKVQFCIKHRWCYIKNSNGPKIIVFTHPAAAPVNQIALAKPFCNSYILLFDQNHKKDGKTQLKHH